MARMIRLMIFMPSSYIGHIVIRIKLDRYFYYYIFTQALLCAGLKGIVAGVISGQMSIIYYIGWRVQYGAKQF